MLTITQRKPTAVLSRLGFSFFVFLGLAGARALGQETLPAPADSAPAAPVAPRFLSLPECIALGLEKQPAVAAARAHMGSALAAQRGVDNLRLAALLARDLPIRRKQAALGVEIAAAGLYQIEWDTRYAVTRTYWSCQYARMQKAVVQDVLEKLDEQLRNAQGILEAKDAKFKVGPSDPNKLALNISRLRARQEEIRTSEARAIAALREAMGVALDCSIYPAGEELLLWPVPLECKQLVVLALARRGEIGQAICAEQVTHLEVEAQGKSFLPTMRTFASGSDIHSKQIPQGVANTEYRPGALGMEMPVLMVGHRKDRVDRAHELNLRAGTVTDKTHQLITLEVEALFYKWQNASQQAGHLKVAAAEAAQNYGLVLRGFRTGEETAGARLEASLSQFQTRAEFNEALFNSALGLAGLERATAGGFSPPWAPAPVQPEANQVPPSP